MLRMTRRMIAACAGGAPWWHVMVSSVDVRSTSARDRTRITATLAVEVAGFHIFDEFFETLDFGVLGPFVGNGFFENDFV